MAITAKTFSNRLPASQSTEAVIKVILPKAWYIANNSFTNDTRLVLEPLSVRSAEFTITTPEGLTVPRARIAGDITIDNHPFAQQAEALITIV